MSDRTRTLLAAGKLPAPSRLKPKDPSTYCEAKLDAMAESGFNLARELEADGHKHLAREVREQAKEWLTLKVYLYP